MQKIQRIAQDLRLFLAGGDRRQRAIRNGDQLPAAGDFLENQVRHPLAAFQICLVTENTLEQIAGGNFALHQHVDLSGMDETGRRRDGIPVRRCRDDLIAASGDPKLVQLRADQRRIAEQHRIHQPVGQLQRLQRIFILPVYDADRHPSGAGAGHLIELRKIFDNHEYLLPSACGGRGETRLFSNVSFREI